MDTEPRGAIRPVASKTGSAKNFGVLTALAGFLIAVALYFWFISANGVDMIRADQWFDIKLIHDSSAGTLSWGGLWAPHGENRVLFQNLITLLLAHFFHYNVLIEEYLSATFLVAALALLVLTHRRRSPSTPLIWYCPAAFLLLTVGQWGGTLYGYALGWYLIIVCLALMLWLLDRPHLSWFAWSVAVGAAVIASFSSLQGLFVWVAGMTILLQRRRPLLMALAWLGAALLTTGLYFYGWNASQGNGVSYALGHPGATVQYFFFAVGDIVSVPLPDSPHGAQYLVLGFGVAVFAVAVWSLVNYGFRADEASARPVGVALIWVGLLFAGGASAARTVNGISNASFSLYVSFDLLILLGCFLVVIDRVPAVQTGLAGRTRLALVMRAAIGALVLVQVIAGTVNGLRHGAAYRDYETTGAVVTSKINDAPDGLVASQLGAGYETADFIRSMTSFARSEHLSLFSTSQVQWYERQPLPINGTAPTVVVEKPRPGDVLHGVTFLDAAASDPFGVTEVRFFAQSGNGSTSRSLIGMATWSQVGWLLGWDTRRLPNGTYSIQAIASSPGGLRSSSAWVRVQLRN
jgi:Bacterial Ig domain